MASCACSAGDRAPLAQARALMSCRTGLLPATSSGSVRSVESASTSRRSSRPTGRGGQNMTALTSRCAGKKARLPARSPGGHRVWIILLRSKREAAASTSIQRSMKSWRAGCGRRGDSRCGWSSSTGANPGDPGRELLGVGEERRPELRRHLHAQPHQLRSHHGVPPLRRERLLGRGRAQPARAGQHPVRAGARPQRAVGERGAERAHHRARVVLVQLLHGQPVGGDAAVVQAVVQQLEVFAAVQVHDAGRPWAAAARP